MKLPYEEVLLDDDQVIKKEIIIEVSGLLVFFLTQRIFMMVNKKERMDFVYLKRSDGRRYE